MIDLNCDMGEGMGNDEAIMPFINSANIACGFHAGNGDTIRRTIELAMKYTVHIGAHPSFRDKENFGRTEMHLSSEKLYAIVLEQLIKIELIAKEKNTTLHHIKLHGALYNMAARDRAMAKTVVQAVNDFNDKLIFYGLSNSVMIEEAKAAGLKTASEAFADRTYQDDGSLTPRSEANALVEDEAKAVQRVLQMVKQGTVTTVSGKIISITADTICIHGDGKNAVGLAKNIRQALQEIKLAKTI